MAKAKITSKSPKATTAKKGAAQASRSKAVTAPVMHSFRPSKNPHFYSFKFTRQSVYWLVLGTLILSLAAWVLSLQLQIYTIYQNIEFNSNAIETYLPIKRADHQQ